MKKSKASPAQARRNAVIEQARQAVAARAAQIELAYATHKLTKQKVKP